MYYLFSAASFNINNTCVQMHLMTGGSNRRADWEIWSQTLSQSISNTKRSNLTAIKETATLNH